MSVTSELLEAKQVLSARLLQTGLTAGVMGRVHTLSVREAVAWAGRNVHAVGVGQKLTNGQPTGTMAVRIYVVQKVANSLLPPRDALPESIEGIPTDVIETPPAFITSRRGGRRTAPAVVASDAATCTEDRRKRQRPVVAGISAAHFDVTAGTISCFCRSTRHGDAPTTVYVMSNNHVFADVNQGNVRDDLYQPGPLDGGTSSHHFADLHRFVPIRLGGSQPNRVDAAIGELRSSVQFKAEVCSIGNITGTARAVEDMEVRKHGRTTGYTEGVVTDVVLDTLVGMDHNDPSVVALFENQIRIDRVAPFSAFGLGGDSGSLVVSRSAPDAVGLYFAGPDSGVYGLANHIADVLSELQVELL